MKMERRNPEEARRAVVPPDFPVRVCEPGEEAVDRVCCGTCGRAWDDAVVTAWTPAPAARCPFEAYHTLPEHTR